MLPQGFTIERGHLGDRSWLLSFLRRSTQETLPTASLDHLADTVNAYLSAETPLWWAKDEAKQPRGCLWLGRSLDQLTGDRQHYVFLLYVDSPCRRQGLGRALMATAEDFARSQGDRQIALQVYSDNHLAQAFYQQLGFSPQAILLKKTL